MAKTSSASTVKKPRQLSSDALYKKRQKAEHAAQQRFLRQHGNVPYITSVSYSGNDVSVDLIPMEDDGWGWDPAWNIKYDPTFGVKKPRAKKAVKKTETAKVGVENASTSDASASTSADFASTS